MIQVISSLEKEFLVANLRTQLEKLNALLRNIEGEDTFDGAYLKDTLKKIESGLRQIHKFCS